MNEYYRFIRNLTALILLVCPTAVGAFEPLVHSMELTATEVSDGHPLDLFLSEDRWIPDQPATGPQWTLLAMETRKWFGADPDNQIPIIMMAGYMDSDISWMDGGTLRILAWVVDPEEDPLTVEIFFGGEPTGVMLLDDGEHGDFGAEDGLFGLTMEVPERSLPPADYLLELAARDHHGNQSDLWPYLTIHE